MVRVILSHVDRIHDELVRLSRSIVLVGKCDAFAVRVVSIASVIGFSFRAIPIIHVVHVDAIASLAVLLFPGATPCIENVQGLGILERESP